jgi:hypothetical protein
MTQSKWDAVIVALGPLVVGACLALGHGNTLATAVRVPVVFAMVAAMMVPALYIGAALVGIAPPARKMATGVLAAFRSAGVAFLGVAPAVAFLVATESEDQSMGFLGQAVVLAGGLLALRALYGAVFDDCLARGKAIVLYGAWALISLGIGGHLYVTGAVM